MYRNNMKLVLSCEHAGNLVPVNYRHLFSDADELLQTHRGFDIGAIELFRLLLELQVGYSLYSDTTRLLVDLNRSLNRKTLFSEVSNNLNANEKQEVLNNYYHPFRNAFADEIRKMSEAKQHVLHLSVHSFTPVLNGEIRNTDIGILYHPGRKAEKKFALVWKESLRHTLPMLKVRFNYPYLGKPDGHVAFYRKIYSDDQYAGIELEMNQKHANDSLVYKGIKEALEMALNEI